MDNSNDQVVIIGAGICGLATAVALDKKGIKSLVLEKSKSLRNDTGTAIGIWNNGWQALHQLGVADILRRSAVNCPRQRIVSLNEGKQEEGSTNGEFRAVLRKDIIDSLYNALPSDTVKFGCQLETIKLDQNTNKPVLRLADGTSIIPKVVIGCEGGKSVVAEFFNPKPTKMFPLCGIRGLTTYPDGHPFDHEFVRFRKDNILVGRIPMTDTLVYWFCAHPYILKDRRIWEDQEVIRQTTMEWVSDFPKEVQEMIEKTDTKALSFARLRYRTAWDLLTGTFSKGTVTVAGDAMHVMGPFLGQGGSAGLEDAVVLARNMGQLGLNDEGKLMVQGVGEAFKMYVKQRRMRVVKVSLQTYLTGMLLGAASRLEKVMYFVLLSLLFSNPVGHTDYDCGVL
ncbi:monooxygenase 1-like [Rutidosis leptorrhynchoides]|uniref:monooxygenase 1-like n=1 Tax=Rutidosis leptorrhynchoides TaxID=125765 RepID=UPI003A998E1D